MGENPVNPHWPVREIPVAATSILFRGFVAFMCIRVEHRFWKPKTDWGIGKLGATGRGKATSSLFLSISC